MNNRHEIIGKTEEEARVNAIFDIVCTFTGFEPKKTHSGKPHNWEKFEDDLRRNQGGATGRFNADDGSIIFGWDPATSTLTLTSDNERKLPGERAFSLPFPRLKEKVLVFKIEVAPVQMQQASWEYIVPEPATALTS